jgi:hypothetical protein
MGKHGKEPASLLKTISIRNKTRKKIEAQARAQADGLNAIVSPLAVVTEFPSKYVEIVRHWEKQDEGLVDPATIPLEGEDGTPEDFYPRAVSQAQAFWARGELAKAKRGGHTKLSIPELEALANTPLAGLPERAGQKAPAKKSPAKKATKAKATPKAKAKGA